MNTDISYLLYWDDDTIPIEGNMTFGNHLENDIVVPGEDVADFHARIDLSDRGPVVIPLGPSTVSVNGRERAAPLQLIIGDVVGIGQATMQIGIEVEANSPTEVDQWFLHPDGDGEPLLISRATANESGREITVGRSDAADLQIPKEHISRHHARIVERDNFIWLQDLNSANGTRINDTPLQGGARLFHGDYISFDKERYQLIGRGGDLTPVEHFVEPLRGTTSAPPQPQRDTTEFSPVSPSSVPAPELPSINEPGAFLIGMSGLIEGHLFKVALGETLIGRSDHCTIQIDDATISHEHAQIKVRPEGVVVTNLMSTNGTKINGTDITSAALNDGDVLTLGQVSLTYKAQSNANTAEASDRTRSLMQTISSKIRRLFD